MAITPQHRENSNTILFTFDSLIDVSSGVVRFLQNTIDEYSPELINYDRIVNFDEYLIKYDRMDSKGDDFLKDCFLGEAAESYKEIVEDILDKHAEEVYSLAYSTDMKRMIKQFAKTGFIRSIALVDNDLQAREVNKRFKELTSVIVEPKHDKVKLDNIARIVLGDIEDIYTFRHVTNLHIAVIGYPENFVPLKNDQTEEDEYSLRPEILFLYGNTNKFELMLPYNQLELLLQQEERKMLVSTQKNTYLSNVVSSNVLKQYQESVLNDLKNILINSFGPYGSNTCIKQTGALNVYTKDGYTILTNVKFTGIVEESIRSDIETITKEIAETVGDGTTSAVILSYYLFKSIHALAAKHSIPPVELIKKVEEVINDVCKGILSSAKECTIEDIYDIAYISSNSNDDVAKMISDLYEECGMGVFIDVAISTAKETAIKYYDGMTLATGYCDTAFITNTSNNTSVIDNPEIYFFEDPIDTKEMGVYLDAIISTNIMAPLQMNAYEKIVPTVIVAPKVTRDMSSILDSLIEMMAKATPGSRLPICVITDTHQIDELMDICNMCNAKPIRKYIDAEMFKRDVEAGLAPTPETISNWAGHAEEVVADSVKTKFINPVYMATEDKTVFNNLLSFVESSLQEAIKNGDDSHTIGTLKRRLHSLKSNLVEIHVGGMTVADRDSTRHLVEDAVKNCRSAAEYGVGWGSNFSALNVINKMEYGDDLENEIADELYDAYHNLTVELYHQSGITENELAYISKSTVNGCPLNIKTMEFDHKVKSSIMSDVTILKSVGRIVSIMATCNQFLTPNPQMNVYEDLKEVALEE